MRKKVQVAVAVVLQADQVLIAKRGRHQHQGGLWEFPGGKIAVEETPFQALVRELQEEVNLTVEQAKPFITLEHIYSDKYVNLIVYLVEDFSGKPQGLEGQPVKWVPITELTQYNFPEANQAIIEKLQQRIVK